MSTPALVEALAVHVAALGHGVYRLGSPYRDDDIAIVVDDVVPAPDRLLVVRAYDSGGEPDSRNPWSEPRLQFRVRDVDRAAAAVRGAALFDDLHGAGPMVLSGIDVMSIICLQDGAVTIGRDPSGRHEYTVNARVDYVHPTAHRA